MHLVSRMLLAGWPDPGQAYVHDPTSRGGVPLYPGGGPPGERDDRCGSAPSIPAGDCRGIGAGVVAQIEHRAGPPSPPLYQYIGEHTLLWPPSWRATVCQPPLQAVPKWGGAKGVFQSRGGAAGFPGRSGEKNSPSIARSLSWPAMPATMAAAPLGGPGVPAAPPTGCNASLHGGPGPEGLLEGPGPIGPALALSPGGGPARCPWRQGLAGYLSPAFGL